MEPGNKADFFRRTDVRPVFWLALALLGGCSHATRKPTPPSTPSPQTVDIGIPACNAYLYSYLACHRAAHIFPADTLESHYQAMLLSLQQSAADPRVRPYLAGRCVDLRQQLNAALQGRSCTAPATNADATSQPAPASTTPIRTQH
ncbi:hypothetical protein [Dyella flava]|uniref:Lipoprotein n=1 Tax=Dyella flava TaxID=1920170 RepID=A0ABS2K8C0_9GAMM|nr:hypothetical protein [Dyella flava]MBM7127461.1 hypothetical protein [Dyella flava]GLQ51060.1 hypothetical protein GCM10010872_25090 [Dyella flava]